MGVIERVMCALLPHKDIYRDGKLYLRRFYLTPLSWKKRVFIHHIFLPDPDPHPHDHPWAFKTWVFRRWYKESYVDGRIHGFFCGVGKPVDGEGGWKYRKATFRHRITQVAEGGAWTLVVAEQATREWGFWVGENWQPWYQYLGQEPVTAPEDRIP